MASMVVLKNIKKGLWLEYSLRKREFIMKNFSYVSLYTTNHSTISLVASQRWTFHQMDVKTTFFHGSLQEEVYVEKP